MLVKEEKLLEVKRRAKYVGNGNKQTILYKLNYINISIL